MRKSNQFSGAKEQIGTACTSRMGQKTLGACLLSALIVAGAFSQGALAQAGSGPRLFAPGVVSGPADDFAPTFSPDGKTVYFTRGNTGDYMILVSTFANGLWSRPQMAPFSGKWRDMEPAMAPDGSFLVFASNRPANPGGKPIDGHFNGKTIPAGGGNLWRVDRVRNGNEWGEPERLPDLINANTGTFSPNISTDGSIYFMRPDEKTGNFHLYRSQFRESNYLPPVLGEVGDATTEEVDPAIAPDESYLVYSSNHPLQHDPKRLRIMFRRQDGWGSPIDLGDDINEKSSNVEARLGADSKTLYFSASSVPPVSFPHSPVEALQHLKEMEVWANGRSNIWFVSLTPWLDKRERQQ